MSNTRYLEIDSTYRDRNLWPLPGEFEVPISQSGRKNIENALDPVSLAVPIEVWTSNNLNTLTHNKTLLFNIRALTPLFPIPPVFPLIYSSDKTTFIISGPINTFQKQYNYYRNLVLVGYPGLSINNITAQRRIKEYIYLYSGTDTGGVQIDVAQITLNSPLPDSLNIVSNNFRITDPTDLSDPYNPYFFVPFGRFQSDAYTSFILYNETVNEYRKIINYNELINMLYVDTTKSTISTVNQGPVTGWSETDNYSIRKEAPSIGNSSAIFISPISSTSSTLIINGLPNNVNNYYKHKSIRILPVSGGTYDYSYDSGNGFGLVPLINESSNIVSSTYDTTTNLTTLIVSPAFTSNPTLNYLIEIMNFSFDNLCPFVYTGSLVSQQEMVCYEIKLLDLLLPNDILSVGDGGRIAFYPYVYVQLSNVSASGAGLKNIIYSNNPNATNVTFRAPIYDVQNPSTSSFVKVDGNGITQTIKFKPNDNLFFRVTLPNGEVYQNAVTDTKSPSPVNYRYQISALFSLKRL